MKHKTDETSKYLEAKKRYNEMRDDIVEKAAEMLPNKKSVHDFETKTNEWLEKIESRHLDSKYSTQHEAVDKLLTALIGFATNQNLSSLDNINSHLQKSSVQDIEELMNKHSEEITKNLQNSMRHIDQHMPTAGYAKASHRR